MLILLGAKQVLSDIEVPQAKKGEQRVAKSPPSCYLNSPIEERSWEVEEDTATNQPCTAASNLSA